MNANNFPLEKLSIGQLYNSGDITYEIPIYQRNYAWEEDQIRTLVQDIYDAFKATPQKESYYIGTLVTFDKGDKVYEVIDGQQRLTTVYLMLKVLKITIKNKLTYRSRKKSKDTLEKLPLFNEMENVDTDIQNGYYYAASAIPDIIDASETERFSNYLQHNVHILHYTVPKDVDLNHYFEVMNSRGEQLEKHEIVKAYLCETLDQEEMKKFNHIWENCSRMDVYIQQLLDNNKIFGSKLNECPNKCFDDLPNCPENGKAKNTIRNFMHGNIENLTEKTECDKNDTFQPIVDFPNFLLIVLKITRILDKNDDFNPTGFILDDKELINEFDKVERKNKDFVKNFAFNLLKAKFLLDNYIIHHTYEEDKIGVNPWQLRKFVLEDNKRSTKNLSDDTEIQDRLVQLLSMFFVPFLNMCISTSHKSPAAQLGHLPKPQGFVKSQGFGGVVRCQLNLPHLGKAVQDFPEQGGAYPLALMGWEYQNVLHQHHGAAVSHGSHQTDEFLIFVSSQSQKGIGKAPGQHRRLVCIRCPSHGSVKGKNFLFPVSCVFSDFHFCNLHKSILIGSQHLAQSHTTAPFRSQVYVSFMPISRRTSCRSGSLLV